MLTPTTPGVLQALEMQSDSTQLFFLGKDHMPRCVLLPLPSRLIYKRAKC